MKITGNTTIDECESTNDLARELALSGAADGTWISARRQTRGRGRQGKSWHSLDGNLFLSSIARNVPVRNYTWVPLVAGIAAAQVLGKWGDIRIKWPNDLLLDSAKLGGILCEGAPARGFIVVGIGINCVAAPSAEQAVDQQAICLEGTCLRAPSCDELRVELIPALSVWLGRLAVDGPDFVAEEFFARSWVGRGDTIEEGTVLGLGPRGELRVSVDGRERLLTALV